jgi:hypothetical protein
MWVAAVARVFDPGVKYDYVLTLVGPEGKGKSTIFDKMAGQWFSDSLDDIHGVRAYESLQGVWLIELGELSGIKKAEVEAVKKFVAKRIDRFRVAYGRRSEDFPRQCIFVGSTNEMAFLMGINGDRRFWPVAICHGEATKNVFTQLNKQEICQLWAQALHLYRLGETIHLDDEMEAQALKVQRAHAETDERAGIIGRYLDMLLPTNWDEMDVYERKGYIKSYDSTDSMYPKGTVVRTRVCIPEVWVEALDGWQKEMNGYNTKLLHNVMRNMSNWAEQKAGTGKGRFSIYGVQKTYVRSLKHDNVSHFTENRKAKQSDYN